MQVKSQQGYMLDTCIMTIVDSIVAPQHRHGVIQLMVSLDGEPCSVGSSLEQKRISADELSQIVGLSKSHFLRTFSQELGIPLRPYLQWLRLMDAFVVLTSGGSVTEAAAEAGFSDSAHLNRVTQRAFAMNPTALGRVRDTFHVDNQHRSALA